MSMSFFQMNTTRWGVREVTNSVRDKQQSVSSAPRRQAKAKPPAPCHVPEPGTALEPWLCPPNPPLLPARSSATALGTQESEPQLHSSWGGKPGRLQWAAVPGWKSNPPTQRQLTCRTGGWLLPDAGPSEPALQKCTPRHAHVSFDSGFISGRISTRCPECSACSRRRLWGFTGCSASRLFVHVDVSLFSTIFSLHVP